MTFSQFAKIIKPIIGGSSNHGAFAKTLLESLLDDDEISLLDGTADSTFRAYYNANTGISKIAKTISPHMNTENFVEYLNSFSDKATSNLCKKFKPYIEDININNYDEKIAYYFASIIKNAAKGRDDFNECDETQNDIQLPPSNATETTENFYSDEDKMLLQEFQNDYDKLILKCMGNNFSNFILNENLPKKISHLYNDK